MTILWSFSYNSFVKFHSKRFGSQNMTVLYPDQCYNKVCYKGTAVHCKETSVCFIWLPWFIMECLRLGPSSFLLEHCRFLHPRHPRRQNYLSYLLSHPHHLPEEVWKKYTVNVLKFRTLFSFCSRIKCWFSGLELAKCLSNNQTGFCFVLFCLI